MPRTHHANRFATTLTAAMGPTDLTAAVFTTAGAPTSPCYLVVDYDVPDKAEIVKFDGTFSGTSFTTTTLTNRYLPGSAASSGITHDVDAAVISAPLGTSLEDIWDAIDAHTASPHPGGDAGWTAHTGVAAAGWGLGVDGHCETRIVGDACYVDIDIERTGGAVNPGSNANITDVTVLTLPAGRRPDRQTSVHYTVGDFTHGTGIIDTTGDLVLQTLAPGTSFGSGNRVHVSTSYPLA